MIREYPPLYKRDSKGKIREWRLQRDGDKYRTVAGLLDGKKTVSEWRVAIPASQDTAEEQAHFECDAHYRHQLERDYFLTIEEIDTPRIFEPMLAHTYKDWPGECITQPKLDGIRCVATAGGLFSREGKIFLNCPHIERALEPLFAGRSDRIIDGEFYNHELKDDFNTISSLVRKKKPTQEDLEKSAEIIQFHIYDQYSPAGFSERYEDIYNDVVNLASPVLQMVHTERVAGLEALNYWYEDYLSHGYEGQMVRLDGVGYEKKRSRTLLKRKVFKSAEFELIRKEEGQGNWAGHAKRAILRLPDGRPFGAGIAGDKAFTKALLTQDHKSVTLKFFDYTPDGIPRFGVVVDWHETKRQD